MRPAEDARRDRRLAGAIVDAYEKGWEARFTGEVFAKDVRPTFRPDGRIISRKRVKEAARGLRRSSSKEFGSFPRYVDEVLDTMLWELARAA